MDAVFKEYNLYTLGYLLNIAATAQRCNCDGVGKDDVCERCEINGGDLVDELLAAIAALKEQTK